MDLKLRRSEVAEAAEAAEKEAAKAVEATEAAEAAEKETAEAAEDSIFNVILILGSYQRDLVLRKRDREII